LLFAGGLAACGLALASACSLHSLDYLGAGGATSTTGGDASERGGEASEKGGATGTTGGDASVKGGRAGTTGGDATGTTGGGAAAGPVNDAGAAGTADSPRCDDMQTNGEETDLDCGGRTCGQCEAGKRCAVGTDCQSAICTNVVCQAPTCTDLAVNGSETDFNCGGSCPPCAQGKHCSVDHDCDRGSCTSGICESKPCADGALSTNCSLLTDNTPYSLSPAKFPTNCIDDELDSTADGNALRIHPCKSELRQTFWAVQGPDGYFAFRNALSGKCLHVRGASTTGGATVEQSTCSFANDQLWKPSLVDAKSMTITSRLKDKSLNVLSDLQQFDGQPIVYGQSDGTADTLWRVTRRSTAAYVTFSPEGQLTTRLQHDAEQVTLGTEDQVNSQWIVVPGLSDASMVSFQSRNDPGRYLRHAVLRLWSDTNDGTEAFKRDATFRYAQPLVGFDRLAKSLELSSIPGLYWKSDVTGIAFALFADNPDYRLSSTWRLVGR